MKKHIKYPDDSLCGCDMMQFDRHIPAFQRIILPPPSMLNLKMEAAHSSEMLVYIPTKLHSVTSQKKVIFTVATIRTGNLGYKISELKHSKKYFDLKH
jgi:hypothetical protein